MKKGISPMVSLIFVIAISVAGMVIVLRLGNPLLEKTDDFSVVSESKENMKKLNSAIKDVYNEGEGSTRKIDLISKEGEYIVSDLEDSIFFEMKTKYELFPSGIWKRDGDVYLSTGADVSAYEKDITGDGETEIVLENSYVLFALNKTGNETNLAQWNTEHLIKKLWIKELNKNITPQNSELEIFGLDGSSKGIGYSKLIESGSHLSEGKIKFYIETDSGLSYTLLYILGSKSDFVRVNVSLDTGEKFSQVFNPIDSESDFSELENTKVIGGSLTTGWWNTSFKKCQNISLSSTIDDYQYKVVLNTTNFNYSYSTGSDIRIVNSSCGNEGKLMNHWTENWNETGNSVIWFRGDNSSTTTYSIYYNNTDAYNKSDGEKTFLFFDDFNDNSFDENKWTVDENTSGTGVVSESNQRLVLGQEETSKRVSVNGTDFPVSIGSDLGLSLEFREWTRLLDGSSCRVPQPRGLLYDGDLERFLRIRYAAWSGPVDLQDSYGMSIRMGTTDTQYNWIITDCQLKIFSGSYYGEWDEVETETGTLRYFNASNSSTDLFSSTNNIFVRLRMTQGGSSPGCYQEVAFDTVRVRKVNETEPSSSLGSQSDYKGYAVSLPNFFYNITKATIRSNDTIPSGSNITYYLSADNGTNWEEVTEGVEHTFSNSGDILKVKINLTKIGSDYPSVENYTVDFTFFLRSLVHKLNYTISSNSNANDSENWVCTEDLDDGFFVSWVLGGNNPIQTNYSGSSGNYNISIDSDDDVILAFSKGRCSVVDSEESQIYSGNFWDAIFPSFSYETIGYVINLILNYSQIDIINDDRWASGKYQIFVKNEGYSQGKTRVSVSVL